MAPVDYTIPLCDYERKLLAQLAPSQTERAPRVSSEEFEAQSLSNQLLPHWQWVRLVRGYLEDHFGEENLNEEYAGSKASAYKGFLHWLQYQDGFQQNLARARTLERANPDFLQLLGDQSIENVALKPAVEDLSAWQTVSLMYLEEGLYWNPRSLSHPHQTYHILKSVYTYGHRLNSKDNVNIVYGKLITHPTFTSIYKIRAVEKAKDSENSALPGAPGARESEYEFVDTRAARSPEQWPSGIPKTDNGGLFTKEYVRYLLKKAAVESVIEDPKSYLSTIPFSNLTEVSLEELRTNHVNLRIPFSKEQDLSSVKWVVWKPPATIFTDSHLLYTEDEVYGYCVMNDWYFPGHFVGDKVLFAMRPVEDTEFFQSLKYFWESWNDCCLSWDPSEDKLYVLETIPGLRYRSRQKLQDKQAALLYFRNLVEAHAAGTLDDTTVQDVLGIDHYSSLFEYSLRYIPPRELSLVSNALIGSGKFGKVYRAIWRRPEGKLATSGGGEEEIEVVLKSLLRRGGGDGPNRKFLEELDLTYAGLAGSSTGCIDFFGMSTLTDFGEFSPPNGETDPHRKRQNLVLVFAYASEGPLHVFLKNRLSQLSYQESWETVVDKVNNVANGLYSLHRHGIIHRDLHLNNILVTLKHFPDEPDGHPELQWEYSAAITDMGEGKHAADSDSGPAGASIGARDFHAPEVHGARGWTTAADVFALGVVACKVLDMRVRYGRDKEVPRDVAKRVSCSSVVRDEQIVPSLLKDIISRCLSFRPEDRPLIRDVVDKLDELGSDFFAEREPREEKVRWTTWDWWETFEEARSSKAGRNADRQKVEDGEVEEEEDTGSLDSEIS